MPYDCKNKQRAHYLRNKQAYYFRNLKSKYGLSEDDYNSMLDDQGNSCALCDKSFSILSSNLIHVDHCHKTGDVRGILCKDCNVGLGLLGDDIEGLLKAIDYLKGEHYAG